MFIDQASRRLNVVNWGARLDDGHHYLAAHLLAVAQAAGASAPGQVRSEQVGDIAVSYAVTDSKSELASTSYGRTYSELRGEIMSERCL